jgi:drug/metabolite transporter (DMT)-like permease
MPQRYNQQITPAVALGLAMVCVIFGANAVAIKISLSGIGTFTAAAVRFAMGAFVIYSWARLTGRSFHIKRNDMGPLLVLCGLVTVQLSLFYLGLSRTLASRGALVVNVVPFLVLIFAHFFIPEDRLTIRKIVGMLLGFGGVALVMTDSGTLEGGWRTGDSIILAAATCWAAGAVYTKRIIHRYDPFQLVLYPLLFAAPVQLLEGWLWDEPMLSYLNGGIVVALLYSSLICTAFGLVVWNTMLNRYGASILHTFVFIVPIVGVAAGGLILNEPITLRLIAAVALVAAGIGIVNIRTGHDIPTSPVGRSF